MGRVTLNNEMQKTQIEWIQNENIRATDAQNVPFDSSQSNNVFSDIYDAN
jgi:hypothetical protein